MTPMAIPPRSRPTLRVLALLAALPLPALSAQGVAGAAVEGIVVEGSGHPVAGALVVLHHTRSGAEYRVTSGARGGFRLVVDPAPGPWVLEARMIGRTPARIADLTVALGDRLYRRLVLGVAEAVALPDVAVRTVPIAADGGPGYVIPGDGIRGLPLLNRNFVGLFATVPHAVGRNLHAISGQHPAYNAIQIDGGTANDVYGVGRTPGAVAGARSISLEALAGVRVLVAPFDVRQGGFSGGLINVVTRSGTNRLEGSIFSSLQRPFLVGQDTAGRAIGRFDRVQYGFTLGGPIRRDRLHFFVAADLQHSATPFVGPEAGSPGTGISDSTARRAAEAFRTVYGFDAGGPAPPVIGQPDRNLFAKLSWQPASGHRLELSHNFVDARSDRFNREVRDRPNRDGWQLSRSGGGQTASVHTTRLRAAMSRRRWQHELLAGYQTIAEAQTSTLGVPLFLVEADQPGIYLAGGSTVTGQGTILDQRLFELTAGTTWSGDRHEISAGAQAQVHHFTDNLFVNAWGVWRFSSVTALERKEPNRYEVNLPLREGGPVADFGARLLALWLQDRWMPSERAAITAGLRVEVPLVDAPLSNPALQNHAGLGRIDTGDFPSGNVLLAPRIGLLWDLAGGWRTVLRGGAGVFTGRTPFAWMGGAFSNTGLDQETLICTPLDGIPPPVTDPSLRPSRCLDTSGRPPAAPSIVAFDPAFRFPQAVKLLVGLDHAFGADVTASVDLIHTRTRNAAYLTELNLTPLPVSAEGRAMYGTITPIGAANPARVDPAFRQVLWYDNTARDRSTAVAATLSRTWPGGAWAQLGYQWSRTDDVFTVNRISATLTFQTTPVDGSLAGRRLTRSGYDVPHSVTASGAVPLPGGLTLAVLARRQSGRPYAWTVTGDANADGVASNDLMYVPRTAADISLADPSQYPALEAFIAGESCLRRQRGRLVARNSCRNPAFTTLDARLSWTGPVAGRSLELGADLFNLPNLLHGTWGLIRETSPGEAKGGLLTVSGWDEGADRPVYSLPTSGGAVVLPGRRTVLTDLSRWRIQLGARARF